MRNTFYTIMTVLVIAAMVVLFGNIAIATIDYYVNTEVERYSIGMEITHMEESTYYIRSYGTETTRTFYLCGNNKSIAAEVNGETYARFKQGDWVEVEIRVTEGIISHRVKETARIIGAMEN